MEFYIKLSSIEDDEKLKGIVLFEDYGKEFYSDCGAVLTLGIGKDEYYVSSHEEFYIDYRYEIEQIFERLSAMIPDARICYTSPEDEGCGESDVLLKMENDPEIYCCSTLWFEGSRPYIGDDAWCEQVKYQCEEERAEYLEFMSEIDPDFSEE